MEAGWAVKLWLDFYNKVFLGFDKLATIAGKDNDLSK